MWETHFQDHELLQARTCWIHGLQSHFPCLSKLEKNNFSLSAIRIWWHPLSAFYYSSEVLLQLQFVPFSLNQNHGLYGHSSYNTEVHKTQTQSKVAHPPICVWLYLHVYSVTGFSLQECHRWLGLLKLKWALEIIWFNPPHFITRALRVKPAPRQRASSEQTREESPGVQTPVQSSVRCSGNRRWPEGITNHRQQRRTQDTVCGNAPQTLWAAISRGASRQLLKAVSHRKIITQLKKERLHWLLSIHTKKSSRHDLKSKQLPCD